MARVKQSRFVRLAPELAEQLDEFCRRTRREPVSVMRAALELLLADGYAAAERRLTTGLMDPSPDPSLASASALPPPPPAPAADDRAVVDAAVRRAFPARRARPARKRA